MKSFIYPLTIASCLLALSLPAYCQKEKANNLNVNIGGDPNINFNPINNNKYNTELRMFAPLPTAPNQIDVTPLSIPPVTDVVKNYGGAYINSDVVDPDVSNAKQAEELKRQTGQYFSKPIQTVADDQPVEQNDIQDFLKNYYHYLHDSELTSASPPVVPHSAIEAKPKTKKVSSIENSPGLIAKQKKLATTKLPDIGKTSSTP